MSSRRGERPAAVFLARLPARGQHTHPPTLHFQSRQIVGYTLAASQARVPLTDDFPDFNLLNHDNTSVYIDGVKQTVGDFSINPGGGSITLFSAAFGGEEIEVIAHGQNTIGTGNVLDRKRAVKN